MSFGKIELGKGKLKGHQMESRRYGRWGLEQVHSRELSTELKSTVNGKPVQINWKERSQRISRGGFFTGSNRRTVLNSLVKAIPDLNEPVIELRGFKSYVK